MICRIQLNSLDLLVSVVRPLMKILVNQFIILIALIVRKAVIIVGRDLQTPEVSLGKSFIIDLRGHFASPFVHFDDVFCGAIVNLKILGCLFYRQTFFFYSSDELFSLVHLHGYITALCSEYILLLHIIVIVQFVWGMRISSILFVLIFCRLQYFGHVISLLNWGRRKCNHWDRAGNIIIHLNIIYY